MTPDRHTEPRVRVLTSNDVPEQSAIIFCPGCQEHHPFTINSYTRPNWTWNGDLVRPTFSPSLLCWGSRPDQRCHSFVRDGMIQFLDDCHHAMKGQTVDLPPIAESWD